MESYFDYKAYGRDASISSYDIGDYGYVYKKDSINTKKYTYEDFKKYFRKAFEQLYPDKKVCKHMYSIRAGNLKFLESHNVKYFEIKFRQRMNTHDPVHFYMEDQSASINAINKYLK